MEVCKGVTSSRGDLGQRRWKTNRFRFLRCSSRRQVVERRPGLVCIREPLPISFQQSNILFVTEVTLPVGGRWIGRHRLAAARPPPDSDLHPPAAPHPPAHLPPTGVHPSLNKIQPRHYVHKPVAFCRATAPRQSRMAPSTPAPF